MFAAFEILQKNIKIFHNIEKAINVKKNTNTNFIFA